MNKKTGSKIILASFVLIICCQEIFWMLFGKYMDSTNNENRKHASMPELTIENYSNYSEEFEKFYNDNIPFRNNLITINSAIDYYLFKKSTSKRVIIGDDNWLYLDDEGDGDPIGDYKGENLLSEEDLAELARNCNRMKDFLNSQGKEFVIFVTPNKERMYSENLPEHYGVPADTYKALQIVQYLKENTDIRVVYSYDELMRAKNDLSENIWFKTDTHWNEIGGYVGASLLLKELGIELPDVRSQQIVITKGDNKSGDLARMLNLKKQLKNTDNAYVVSGYDTHDVQNDEWDFYNILVYHAKNADNRRIYVYRDSFASQMAEYIGSQFNNSYFRHKNSYTYEDFLDQDPDIFVYETVERYIGDLATFSIDK